MNTAHLEFNKRADQARKESDIEVYSPEYEAINMIKSWMGSDILNPDGYDQPVTSNMIDQMVEKILDSGSYQNNKTVSERVTKAVLQDAATFLKAHIPHASQEETIEYTG